MIKQIAMGACRASKNACRSPPQADIPLTPAMLPNEATMAQHNPACEACRQETRVGRSSAKHKPGDDRLPPLTKGIGKHQETHNTAARNRKTFAGKFSELVRRERLHAHPSGWMSQHLQVAFSRNGLVEFKTIIPGTGGHARN